MTHCQFLGKLFGEDKDSIFKQADIFVFPTFYGNETFGLVNLEAMSYHLPIVTTNEGGIPDVVKDGENGLISEKGDPESLAQCIGKLLENEDLRLCMGERGYALLNEKFTEELFERKLKSILADA